MVFTYNFFVRLYAFVAAVLSPFNQKAKKWIYGRVNWGKNIPEKTLQKRLWLHCASLGEFEQARPIVEKLVAVNKCELVVSFFSPSGYEVRKDYALANAVFTSLIELASNPSNANPGSPILHSPITTGTTPSYLSICFLSSMCTQSR
jgi:3-deoxy-D-manno-octulosonic-acid transferase